MIGIGFKEEEEGEDIGMSNVTAVPKVEVQEVPESYSCWEDRENRFNSSEEKSDTEKSPKKARKPRTKELRLGERTDDAAKKGVFPASDFEPNAAEKKSKGKTKTKPKTKRQSKTLEEGNASNSKEKTAKGPQSYQCTLCGKIYKSSNNLREHETTHFPDRKNHKCHICSQEFARRNYYLRHMKMHQTENQFKCNECDKIYPSDKKLQEHIRITHRGERPFQCNICSKTFPRSFTLNHHVQAVHEKIRKKTFRCEKCTRTFENKTAYERHMNSHEGIKLNQCSHCGKNYEFKAYLLQHIAEKHPETVENLSRCQFCGVGYSTDGYYRKHIVKRHLEHLEAFDKWMKAKPVAFWRVSEIEIQVEDSRFPQSCCLRCRDRLQEVEDLRALCLESDRKLRKMMGVGLKEDENVEDIGIGHIESFPKVEAFDISESYSCWNDAEGRLDSNGEADIEGSSRSADTEFARRKYYSTHLKMHRTENQFKCNECDKAFHEDKLLQEHIRTKHRGERPYQCKLCPKTYTRSSSLFMHVQINHENIKKALYRCDKCTKSFLNRHHYERHVNSHEGLKLNQCPHCGTKYEYKAYLVQHIAEKHPETVENLSRCQYCGVGYSTDGYYRKHIVKRHPEHLREFDQCMKEKRDAMTAGSQSPITANQDAGGSSS
ncbi:zinc finger and BTB domain-containing protein 6 [Culex quinquefasciatus]|uniref:Zinc finger and BTB domain-containing protein 6 n=1 Tax=Culex quinquefasciatus TaxID=7176 RepID=B0X6F9_CULQU|nr:zinc finger and BTB domain-containing protein 6 [Culex quinquefasciatus]|eukprot:XP_001865231.1 zinc finger and BTB domain-containing protein 6 [Culex quinquefasciatus]